ncbi:MAG: MBL fold metallo-hydrolase [Thaumarchaeota archaeon S15]|nr:MAG: MBL fold metallo-hydrolase [Thaumarchaeota archaeon S13]RNJ75164.1 MAG: MBL fold metallo-hydrolase [Thaumarchaeota archaeon S15]
MIVRQVPVGTMANFTYVIADEATRECIVVDPSWDLDRVAAAIRDMGVRVGLIVNTHHHFDHTTGNAEMARMTGAPIAQHRESDLERSRELADGDEIALGGSSLRVLHTPGHSRDSICLVGEGMVVSGDTLFVGSCGRVDLPGGSARELYRSLFGAMSGLDDSLVLYPGHDYGPSPTSTMGRERRTNPVLQPRTEDEFAAMLGG